MMTWLSVNQIPTLTGAKWPIASHPATLCRLKLADVKVYTYTGATTSGLKNEGPVGRKKYVRKNMQDAKRKRNVTLLDDHAYHV